MPRRSEKQFHCQPLAALTSQLLHSPAQTRLTHLRRLEKLHDRLDPDANYPLEFITYQITGLRPETDLDSDPTLLVGEAILPDLRGMIDVISRSTTMPAREDETVETAQELANRLNVSTKTIARWRDVGLRWRWMDSSGATRKQLIFPRAAVVAFLNRYPQRVERAAHFSQIDAETKAKIIDRARRIALAKDVSLHQVARHLAKKFHRAPETIRLLLLQHDRDNAQHAIFVDRTGPLDAHQKRVIARALRMGVRVEKIARHYNRTRSTIYRAGRDQRVAAIRRLKITYVESPTFRRDDAEQVILREPSNEARDSEKPAKVKMSTAPVDDLPEALRSLYRQPAIDAKTQQSLLVRYNYLKFRAAVVQEHLDKYEPRVSDLDDIERFMGQAMQLRDRLISANLPAVLSLARRHLMSENDQSLGRLIELLEIGNDVLIEVIDKANIQRNQTIGQALSYAVLRRYAAIPSQSAAPRTSVGVKVRAHRRETPQAVLQRMIDKAGESGVHLAINPDEDEPRVKKENPPTTSPPS